MGGKLQMSLEEFMAGLIRRNPGEKKGQAVAKEQFPMLYSLFFHAGKEI